MLFPTTNWRMLAEATLSGDAHGRAALGTLCELYHEPVRAFLLARGLGAEEAADFTQEFFAELLASRLWKRADKNRGRFRSFLLGALRHVEQHAHEKRVAAKRGGGRMVESLDALAEAGLELPAASQPEDGAFDREWALALVARAVAAVESRTAAVGAEEEFAVLKTFLPGAWTAPSYEEAAAALCRSVPAVKSAVLRLRGRFREELRAAVALTVAGPHEVDEEMMYLRRLLAAG